MSNLPQKPLENQGQFVAVFHGQINQNTEMLCNARELHKFLGVKFNARQNWRALNLEKILDNNFCLLHNNRKGASKHPITNSVIATPSDFLLPMLSVMGKMNLSVRTVARLLACFEHLVHPTSNRVKSQLTGVLANV
ncbi:hypothetical protein MOVS_01400 [Moraxella ovis]|uniref:Phage anti-repressor protein n=1 Tax=Moraxella ovis TaxID=29433 RepID=A0A378PHQ0_9GAMM|nr:hypothetical protein [Moraxella ovis]ANB90870.1 hypothetical protein MOVS_01400 [Moraxella ovis]STY86314.1 Phage anti-repressor protein [Moraxella ovis]